MADYLTIQPARITTARDAADVLIVAIPVTNNTNHSLYVWATPRAIAYDPGSQTLTVRLAENPTPLGGERIDVISTHPRLPQEIALEPGESAQLQVRVPPVLHVVDLDAPRAGLGFAVADVEVGRINQVTAAIASSSSSLAELAAGTPVERVSERLRVTPVITTATVKATRLANKKPKGET